MLKADGQANLGGVRRPASQLPQATAWGDGLRAFAKFCQARPDNVELLYYAYHIMVGLGTILILIMAVSAFLLWRNQLEQARKMLWVLMLAVPFPYIATTAGWWTAELGRQPWVVHGLLRTADSLSPLQAPAVATSLVAFIVVYFIVFGAGVLYILRLMSHSPHRGEEGPEQGQPVRAAGLAPAQAVPGPIASPGGGT